MRYYPAFICENGHTLQASGHECTDKFCSDCGAPVISQCPVCNATIRGHRYNESGYYKQPAYCPQCGNPYPWTDRAIQATAEMLAEDDSISADECNRLIEVLPDALVETPKTRLATVRIQKALKNLGNFTADALRQFLLDFACELAKNQLGLK